jgi:transcriptional regulator with XRE-family HTH domain
LPLVKQNVKKVYKKQLFFYNRVVEEKNMDVLKIKSIMKSRKITYEELSEKSKIPLNTLKNIFRGKTLNPRIDTVEAIEKALGLDKEVVQGVSDEEKELMELIKQLPNESTKELIEIIKQLSYDGTKELMAYADFLISKRK